MFVGGGVVGGLFLAAEVPYGDWIGVGVGSVAVFVAFVLAYRQYDPAPTE
jgi:hypothetical protein